ncbi:abasic site processing protein HMCES [Leptopilina heterotoma]|uniref:abasic site processing protein HMCES n=1 Tax=Leptopilina heterotoma TaxID=63436 RepID=UPI001CA9F62B|nr:abasic site processing protein HMCES [Leptopilina heterotoma]
MCGRCACTFEPETLSRACQYKDSSGKYRQAPWIPSKNEDIEYKPSCNKGPRSVLPILMSGSQINNENERILCPMMWGMIPPWTQGDYKKHRLSTHNARLEDLENSKMYMPPLRHGKRCVAIVEGFYEWKRDGMSKQPYYIYSKQQDCVNFEDKTTWTNDWSEETGWQGFQVLKLAGIFNTFKTETGDIVYSFSMLTREANKIFSWLHHRTPCFLRTEEEVKSWLDHSETPLEKALKNLRSLSLDENTINWHPVSTAVNSVFYQENDSTKPVNLEKKEEKKRPSGIMASWLKSASTKRKTEDSDNFENQGKKTPKKD